jgi:hypothetical protein
MRALELRQAAAQLAVKPRARAARENYEEQETAKRDS